MITSVEQITNIEQLREYVCWITEQMDQGRMAPAEADRRIGEVREVLAKVKQSIHSNAPAPYRRLI
jgi:hypothetical protein